LKVKTLMAFEVTRSDVTGAVRAAAFGSQGVHEGWWERESEQNYKRCTLHSKPHTRTTGDTRVNSP